MLSFSLLHDRFLWKTVDIWTEKGAIFKVLELFLKLNDVDLAKHFLYIVWKVLMLYLLFKQLMSDHFRLCRVGKQIILNMYFLFNETLRGFISKYFRKHVCSSDHVFQHGLLRQYNGCNMRTKFPRIKQLFFCLSSFKCWLWSSLEYFLKVFSIEHLRDKVNCKLFFRGKEQCNTAPWSNMEETCLFFKYVTKLN